MSKQAILESVSQDLRKESLPEIRPGDTVRAHVKVREAGKERIQVFEGVCIAVKHGGIAETITVRKIASGVGVERTFPLHSPNVAKFEVTRKGAVRRAKLYYLRGRVGKRARVAERRWGIEDDLVLATEPEPVAEDAAGSIEEAEPEVNPEAEVPAEAEDGEEPAEEAPAGEPEEAPTEATEEPAEDAEESAEGADEPAGAESAEEPEAEAAEESQDSDES